MTDEQLEQKHRFQRIRRLKKILRPLPRRATIHRYPVLKYFAQSARKRPYLWSLKRRRIIRAIYLGCILSLLPLYGLQVILAFVASLLLRCNLMIAVALQFITNPVTAIPLYLLTYKIGDSFLYPLKKGNISISDDELHPDVDLTLMESLGKFWQSTKDVFNSFLSGNYSDQVLKTIYVASSLFIGGIVLGLIIALILSTIYQYLARRPALKYLKEHKKSETKH